MKTLAFLSITCLPMLGQTAASLSPTPTLQFFATSTGVSLPCVGCSLYTYSAGTLTPLATYVDYTGTTTNANPIVLDSGGYSPSGIWIKGSCYKFILQDTSAVTIWTQDQICDNAQLFKAALAASGGAALIGFLPTSGTVATTVAAALNDAFLLDIGYTTFAAACSAAVGAGKTLAVTKAWTALGNQTCAANLIFFKGGSLQISNTRTVTLSGTLIAATFQIFDPSLDGTITFTHKPAAIYAEWWGATADNSTDNQTALQAAITAAKGTGAGDAIETYTTVQLLTGVYRHSTTLTGITGGWQLAGAGQNASILRCTACTGVPQLKVFDYFYGHDFGLDNIGTATDGVLFTNAHNWLQRIWSEPTVGYSTAILHSNNNGSSLHDNFWSDITLPGAANSAGVSGAALYIECGTNFSGTNVYAIEGSTAVFKIGSTCGGGSNPTQFDCRNCFVGATSLSPNTKGVWVVNASGFTLDSLTDEMCDNNSVVCGTQPAIQVDSSISGSITNSIFQGGGAATSGYIYLSSNNARNIWISGNQAGTGINAPSGSCLVEFAAGEGIKFGTNNIGANVTYVSCQKPTWVDGANGYGTSGAVDAHSSNESVRVVVTVANTQATSGVVGYLNYANMPFSSTAAQSPFCTITPATEATTNQLLARATAFYFDWGDTTTARVYLGVNRAGLTAGDYALIFDCPVR